MFEDGPRSGDRLRPSRLRLSPVWLLDPVCLFNPVCLLTGVHGPGGVRCLYDGSLEPASTAGGGRCRTRVHASSVPGVSSRDERARSRTLCLTTFSSARRGCIELRKTNRQFEKHRVSKRDGLTARKLSIFLSDPRTSI